MKESCDDQSLAELNYEYAKDKDTVFYKPMSNANNLTVILKEADPETFRLSEKCEGLAVDKEHVFQGGHIWEGRKPESLDKACWVEIDPSPTP